MAPTSSIISTGRGGQAVKDEFVTGMLLKCTVSETVNHFFLRTKWNCNGINFVVIDLLEFYVISPYIDTKSIHIYKIDSISILKSDSQVQKKVFVS